MPQFRWQLLPIYVGVPCCIYGQKWFCIFLALTGLTLDVLFPLPVFKFVRGPHSVGFISHRFPLPLRIDLSMLQHDRLDSCS